MAGIGMSRRALLGNIAMLGVAAGPGRAFAGEPARSTVQRDFSNPNLEIIRLLREAAEIEQDLMVQYLYGAFSLKPAYAGLVGGPAPNASSFMGVVIQEMQHLGAVNRLLVELDAAPVLARQDFPYESDIYPFAFELVPLGQVSLAKFTYCEASSDALPKVSVTGNESVRLLDQLKTTLGGSIAPNYVGHLYDAVIDTLGEVKKAGGARIDFDAWLESLAHIKTEGEVGHFQFFQSLYEGSHPLLRETTGVWNLPIDDARHPCYQVPVNPTAYSGHANCIADPDLRALAWLGNLNYWVMLSFLDAGYRRKSKSKSTVELGVAQTVMMGPLWSLARQLPAKGAAVPFDPLSMGFEPGLSAASEKRITRLLLEETRDFARSIERLLPADFNLKLYDQLLAAV
jgi:rubrerythrin